MFPISNWLTILLFFFISLRGYSEGSKELRPKETNRGSLHITKKAPFTNFGQYNAPEERQIKIHIASIGEKIYYGLNNKTQAGDFRSDIAYRIVSPSGVIIQSAFIPGTGEGYISSWAEAAAGPAELGNTSGYDALEIFPEETGDYIIEFDISTITEIEEIQIHLFDITVASPDNKAIPGRLHSKGWQLSTEAHASPFHGKVYPYGPNGAVYEVDFNQMEPFTFFINFNSIGTGNTGNKEEDRKSKIGNHSFSEFKVFLNPPDQSVFPTLEKSAAFSIVPEKTDCKNNGYCFKITSDSEGFVEAFLDINQNGIYDADSLDRIFYEEFEQGGEKCIPWDGKDAKGNKADLQQLKLYTSFGYGVTHLPLYDVEQNRNGFRIKVIRPAGAPDPLIFWDDSDITTGNTLGDPLVNLTGCVSSTNGCHKWEDRGDITKDFPELQETINTWWYNTLLYDTLTFDASFHSDAKISFSPDSLIIDNRAICSGDTLALFILNDTISHFDPDRFSYRWLQGSVTLVNDLQELKSPIYAGEPVILTATNLNYPNCISTDTLQVQIYEPYDVDLFITEEDCRTQTGTIEVRIISGAPSPVFHWDDFPGQDTSFLYNLGSGSYPVTIDAPGYSANCTLDTTFTISWPMETRIDSLTVTHAECFLNDGEVFLYLKDPEETYEYSWNDTLTGNSPGLNGLASGNYNVRVRNLVSDCIADTTFVIATLPFSVPVAVTHESCENGEGSIVLNLPDEDFTITWGNTPGTEAMYFLSSGEYTVSVVSDSISTCTWDSIINIRNHNKMPPVEALHITPSDCGLANGSATIEVDETIADYVFSWNGAAFAQSVTAENLSPGEHNLKIRATGGSCTGDTSFIILGKGFSYTTETVQDSCGGNTGSVKIQVAASDARITWFDGDSSFYKKNLPAGKYFFSLQGKESTGCKVDTSATITSINIPIPVDFMSTSTSPDNRYKPNENIEFTLLSPGVIDTCTWDFGDGSYAYNQHTLHAFTEEKTYPITITVTDENGCTGTLTKNLKIGMYCDATLPNAFSPNGDQRNDDIGILGDPANPNLMIFNRWGQVMFQTGESKSRWNGIYQNQEVPVGVYPYVLEFDCTDETGKIYRKQLVGEITLIR